MDFKETVEDYVMRSANLASNMKSHGRPVTHSFLVDKIMNALMARLTCMSLLNLH